jgi:hypothetical protein
MNIIMKYFTEILLILLILSIANNFVMYTKYTNKKFSQEYGKCSITKK